MHVHSISTVSHIDGHKARRTVPARPTSHRAAGLNSSGHAGPWAAPPAQTQPTSSRAVLCQLKGTGGPSCLFLK